MDGWMDGWMECTQELRWVIEHVDERLPVQIMACNCTSRIKKNFLFDITKSK